MITDARRIIADLHIMRARAKALNDGLEAEVAVSISTMVPTDALVAVLRRFRGDFASVSIRLNVGEPWHGDPNGRFRRTSTSALAAR